MDDEKFLSFPFPLLSFPVAGQQLTIARGLLTRPFAPPTMIIRYGYRRPQNALFVPRLPPRSA